uniref:ribosomal protein L24 n=1 Tax=Sahlingia subintegra TaxID=468936 RepID=UPI001FCD4383|nr:ribosomal protein L24 [Sahlingia subintegra]UNJ17332.1 ribosomal protein L24 [Sahlingia subintegra]
MTTRVNNLKLKIKKVSKKLKVGTKVTIISGKQKGEVGEILKIFRNQGTLIVQNINCKKKHQKPTQEGQSGEIIEFEKPIHASNVALVN